VSFERILASIHPITFSCYTSWFEFGEAFDYYLTTLENLSMLTYNVIHSAGQIYDTFYFTFKHHNTYGDVSKTGSEADLADWWYKLGIYYGTATFLIFYTPPTIKPFDPLEEYTGLNNGAHIDFYDDDSDDDFDVDGERPNNYPGPKDTTAPTDKPSTPTTPANATPVPSGTTDAKAKLFLM